MSSYVRKCLYSLRFKLTAQNVTFVNIRALLPRSQGIYTALVTSHTQHWLALATSGLGTLRKQTAMRHA